MPTLRFDALEPERQAAFLTAAATEFAAHGYEQASFNRIIERAGTSKGAIYYYFENKADLYATVVRDAIGRFVTFCGPPPEVDTADAYWRALSDLSGRSIRYYRVDPHIAGLIRSLATDGLSAAPLDDLRRLSDAWFGALATLGQRLGAVRTDLPVDLLLALAMSVSQGFDVWLASHIDTLDDEAIDELANKISDIYRRMATPEAS